MKHILRPAMVSFLSPARVSMGTRAIPSMMTQELVRTKVDDESKVASLELNRQPVNSLSLEM